jgi:hypothetical protein
MGPLKTHIGMPNHSGRGSSSPQQVVQCREVLLQFLEFLALWGSGVLVQLTHLKYLSGMKIPFRRNIRSHQQVARLWEAKSLPSVEYHLP